MIPSFSETLTCDLHNLQTSYNLVNVAERKLFPLGRFELLVTWADKERKMRAEDWLKVTWELHVNLEDCVGVWQHIYLDDDKQFQQRQQAKVMALDIQERLYDTQNYLERDFGMENKLWALIIGKVDEYFLWLSLDSEDSQYKNPTILEFVLENSNCEDNHDRLSLCKLLETWWAGVVPSRFRDSKNNNFKLGNYYDDSMVLSYFERRKVPFVGKESDENCQYERIRIML